MKLIIGQSYTFNPTLASTPPMPPRIGQFKGMEGVKARFIWTQFFYDGAWRPFKDFGRIMERKNVQTRSAFNAISLRKLLNSPHATNMNQEGLTSALEPKMKAPIEPIIHSAQHELVGMLELVMRRAIEKGVSKDAIIELLIKA